MGVLVYIYMLMHVLADDVYSHRINTTSAQFGIVYKETTTINQSYMFEYQYKREHNSLIHLTTSLTNMDEGESASNPAQVVVRQKSAVHSWNLPLEMLHGIRFSSVSRKLCAAAQELSITLPVSVEVTTLSQNPIQFSVYAELQANLSVSIGPKYNIAITQSSPQYYEYTFDENDDSGSVTLYITSKDEYPCSQVTIQKPECPIEDPETSRSTAVPHQTFLKQSAIIIERPRNSSSVYIVFSVTPFEVSCPPVKEDANIQAMKVKNIEFRIVGDADVLSGKYITALLVSLCGYCGLFCVFTGGIICYIICRSKTKTECKTKTQTVTVTVTEDDVEIEIEGLSLMAPDRCHQDEDNQDRESRVKQDEATCTTGLDDQDESGQGEVESSDTAKQESSDLQKKYRLYWEILVILSIFYVLPAVQLFIAYQKYLNSSGDQQICYYNFLCARKLGPFHSFNNLFSNIAYMVFGILFIIIVRVRYWYLTPKEKSGLYGISQHCGIFYAMGWGLIAEGLMSASYHVCPNTANFQFDTTFMYILGTLLLLRLFQSRHSDTAPTAQVAYGSLAVVVIFALFGLVSKSTIFLGIFITIYFLLLIYLSLQFYSGGQFKIRSICKWEEWTSLKPENRHKLGLLIPMDVFNFSFGLYGAFWSKLDFATYMLIIIIGSLTIYFGYYCIMKWANEESVHFLTFFFGFLAGGLGIPALVLFLKYNVTEYTAGIPAISRNQNAYCFMFDFFDTHDIWHFASAGALFCSFVAVLFIDDDLKTVKREKIKRF